jgi:SlyX protein
MTADVETLKQQVEDLQSRLAFQEDAISSLDGALSQQQREILLLRRQLELLNERLQEQAGEQAERSAGPDEKPPHY